MVFGELMSSLKDFFINLMPGFLVYTFAKPYLGGKNLDEGIETAKRLWKEYKLSSTIDMLGEDLDKKEDVEHAVVIYHQVIDRVDEDDMKDYTTVSVKPSSLGYLISEEYFMKNLEEVISYANAKGIEISIDMEDHNYTDITLKAYKALKPKYPLLGTVLQTRLFRTEKDIDELGDIQARIRLCIGIYNEPKEIALTNRTEMKDLMIPFSEKLIANNHFVAFATHDEYYIKEMLELCEKKGYTPQQIEFQMLMGVPRLRIQQEIINKGYTMRLYVPFSERKADGIAYLRRRLRANPHMAIYVMKNILRGIFRPNK